MNNTTALEAIPQAQLEERSVDEVVAQIAKIHKLMESVLKEGEHYGVIPGTPKPSLYKPGAEKICFTFRLLPKFDVSQADHPNGHREYTVTCNLYHFDGSWCGQGVGSCSTMESKYRWRKAEIRCPSCGKYTIRKSKYADKTTGQKGWYCNKQADGCGAQFEAGDPQIEGQDTTKKENPDIADQYNTCLKMAKKRAHVDATITTTAASDIFTQDIEEPELPSDQIAILWKEAAERAKSVGMTREEVMLKLLASFGLQRSKDLTPDLVPAALRIIRHMAAETEMEERIKEEGNGDIIDLPPEEDETPERMDAVEQGAAPELEEPAATEEGGPSSPSARFLDFIDGNDLNPTKARKVAATIRRIKDVRNLSNDDYAAILANTQGFLERYKKEHGTPAGTQAKLDGPGF